MNSIVRILFSIVFFAITPFSAHACSCVAGITPEETYARADTVFIGTVQSVEERHLWGRGSREIVFDVQTIWKGESISTLKIITGTGGGDCGFDFIEGETYFVYAGQGGFYGNERTLETNMCNRTALLSLAEEDVIYANTVAIPFEIVEIVRAEVVEVFETRNEILFGTKTSHTIQDIEVRILDGSEEGETVRFDNDFIILEEGDALYLRITTRTDGTATYMVKEYDRRGVLWGLFALFALLVVLFAGKQGLRSLGALLASLLVIGYVLVPSLASGVSPVPVSVGIAAIILLFAIGITHGVNRGSIIAYIGTMIAVVCAGGLSSLSIFWGRLSGNVSDETLTLFMETGGSIDLGGLLLAAMIIGMLGVLDDVAITQVSVVRELFDTNKNMSRGEVYKRAMRVGKDHIGSLINTLVLAYTGTALPLLILFSYSTHGFVHMMNSEIVATEIVRALVGSIGLIIAVPVTTALAVWNMKR